MSSLLISDLVQVVVLLVLAVVSGVAFPCAVYMAAKFDQRSKSEGACVVCGALAMVSLIVCLTTAVSSGVILLSDDGLIFRILEWYRSAP